MVGTVGFGLGLVLNGWGLFVLFGVGWGRFELVLGLVGLCLGFDGLR